MEPVLHQPYEASKANNNNLLINFLQQRHNDGFIITTISVVEERRYGAALPVKRRGHVFWNLME